MQCSVNVNANVCLYLGHYASDSVAASVERSHVTVLLETSSLAPRSSQVC